MSSAPFQSLWIIRRGSDFLTLEARASSRMLTMTRKTDDSSLSRRRILQGMGGFLAATTFPASSGVIAVPRAQPGAGRATSFTDVTGRLARYMAEARDGNLPPQVALEAKHHILDTLAAIVSGARLKPGEM